MEIKITSEFSSLVNTHYEGLEVNFHVQFTDDHPFKPIILRVITPLFHPSFSNGRFHDGIIMGVNWQVIFISNFRNFC